MANINAINNSKRSTRIYKDLDLDFGRNVVTNDVTITKTLALSKIAIGAKITIIGDTELDQYGTYWLVPSSHMYSGIYSDRHPITWIAKLL